MPDTALQKLNRECKAPRLKQVLYSYCFGEITSEERLAFEAHLLECDFCWQEIQRLDAAVSVLRSEKAIVESELAGAIVDSFGISAKLEKGFGGHAWYLVVVSALYASLYAFSVGLEIAYEFSSYRTLFLVAAPLVFAWIMATSFWAFHVLHSQTVQNRSHGLVWGFTILVGAAAVAFAGTASFLPNHPITQASFQTYTAQAAYLKDVVYFLPVATFFLLLPYGFVLTLQRELKEGRHSLVARLLSGDRGAVSPRGTIYLKFWLLGLLFVLMLIVSLILMSHLLDNLTPASYTHFFQLLLWVRLGIFFILGLWVLRWYYLQLNEIKREANSENICWRAFEA